MSKEEQRASHSISIKKGLIKRATCMRRRSNIRIRISSISMIKTHSTIAINKLTMHSTTTKIHSNRNSNSSSSTISMSQTNSRWIKIKQNSSNRWTNLFLQNKTTNHTTHLMDSTNLTLKMLNQLNQTLLRVVM